MGEVQKLKGKEKFAYGIGERYGLYAVSVLCPLLLPGHHGCQCCGNGGDPVYRPNF